MASTLACGFYPPALLSRIMPPRTKAPIDPASIGRAIDDVAAAVRRDGSLPRSGLAKLGIPKAAQADAIAKLESRGIEATPRFLRLPLRAQLAARLADGATLAMRTIRHALSGGSAREVASAVQDLIASGDGLLILRGKDLALTAARADVLGEPDLAALDRTLSVLTKALKTARKQRARLLRDDVREALAPFALTTRAPASPHDRAPDEGTSPPVALTEVLAAAQKHKLRSGLVFVPTLVHALGGPSARDIVHVALRDAAERGFLELRPESGLARLSAEELDLCVPGPQGSRLSWARPIEAAR